MWESRSHMPEDIQEASQKVKTLIDRKNFRGGTIRRCPGGKETGTPAPKTYELFNEREGVNPKLHSGGNVRMNQAIG